MTEISVCKLQSIIGDHLPGTKTLKSKWMGAAVTEIRVWDTPLGGWTHNAILEVKAPKLLSLINKCNRYIHS